MQAHILAYNQTREHDEWEEEKEILKAQTPKMAPSSGRSRKGRKK